MRPKPKKGLHGAKPQVRNRVKYKMSLRIMVTLAACCGGISASDDGVPIHDEDLLVPAFRSLVRIL